MQRSLSLIILIMLLVGGMVCSPKQKTTVPNENYSIRYDALTLKEYQAYFIGQCTRNPEYIQLGFSKCSKLLARRGIEQFDKVIVLYPYNLEAYMCRAFCKSAIKDYEGAVQDYM